MKKTDQQQLQQYQEEIASTKDDLAGKRGELKALTDRLKKDYNLKPEQLGKRIVAIEKESSGKEKKLSVVMDELKEYFE